MTSVNEIDQFLLTAVERQDVPSVVGIVADKGRVLYHQAFGKLNTASRLRSPAGAMFRVMSMTKPITSVVAMTFHEAGQLGLDDLVSRFLPKFKNPQVVVYFNETNSTYTTRPAEGEIAIRHLLNHTADFGYAFSNHATRLLEQKRTNLLTTFRCFMTREAGGLTAPIPEFLGASWSGFLAFR